jgi:RNA polymerase sigma-70 factor, ECF subfamily
MDMVSLHEFNEELTLHKLAAGDQSSVVCLYDRYSKIAYSLALRITGDVRSAEAVVVEVFIELSRNAVELAPKRASAILFLITKTRRLALRRIRNRDREYCDFLEMETADYPECVISLATRNACSIISHAFAELTEMQRQLLNLAFFDGLTCPEIASRMGATEESVQRGVRGALMGISLKFTSYAK